MIADFVVVRDVFLRSDLCLVKDIGIHVPQRRHVLFRVGCSNFGLRGKVIIRFFAFNPNPHGGGVFHPPPLEVFLAAFLKDINYVPQTPLTFANYLFATF